MKKLFSAALIFTMIFALSACGGQTQETMPATTAPTTAATTVPSTAAPTTEPAGTNIIPDTTMGTNIPDSTVDHNSAEPEANTTDATTGNGNNGSNGSDNSGTGNSGNNNGGNGNSGNQGRMSR